MSSETRASEARKSEIFPRITKRSVAFPPIMLQETTQIVQAPQPIYQPGFVVDVTDSISDSVGSE